MVTGQGRKIQNSETLMNTAKPSPEDAPVAAVLPHLDRRASSWRNLDQRQRLWVGGGLAFVVLLVLGFWEPGIALVRLAAGSELHSHILLVPFISTFLVYSQRKHMPVGQIAASGGGLVALLAGMAAWAAGRGLHRHLSRLSENDFLALMALSFVCFLVAGGFFLLGPKWMRAAAFPAAFLMFMIPLPDGAVEWLKTSSMLASADAANLFFNLSGTPVMRYGTVFMLPGIVIKVAEECSGIRSSLVLVITGLLAAHMFLKTPWRRAVLVAVVIPLGILRNGFRILVIGMLCVEMGPDMIHSPIHHHGGPLFFVLSLVPFFLLLWWLRRGESRTPNPEKGTHSESRE